MARQAKCFGNKIPRLWGEGAKELILKIGRAQNPPMNKITPHYFIILVKFNYKTINYRRGEGEEGPPTTPTPLQPRPILQSL